MKVANAIIITPQRFAPRRLIATQIVLLPLVLLLLAGVVCAQSNRDQGHEPEDEGPSLVEEMRVRLEIKYAEKERSENLDRAREASLLSSELYNNYRRNNVLGANEKKKLDRLEKVTKKIRSRAGGSDGDVSIADMPNQLGPMLKRLADTVDDMRKAVEKTPRQIVSATVIERSNEVLEMIRLIRPSTH
jgi:hypothetical protein